MIKMGNNLFLFYVHNLLYECWLLSATHSFLLHNPTSKHAWLETFDNCIGKISQHNFKIIKASHKSLKVGLLLEVCKNIWIILTSFNSN